MQVTFKIKNEANNKKQQQQEQPKATITTSNQYQQESVSDYYGDKGIEQSLTEFSLLNTDYYYFSFYSFINCIITS